MASPTFGFQSSNSSATVSTPKVLSRHLGGIGDGRVSGNWSTNTSIPATLARSYLWWAEALTRGRVRISHLNAFGVSGDTVGQTASRIATDSPNPYGVTPSKATASIYVLHVGTNSIVNKEDFNSIIASYTDLLTRVSNLGAQVIIVCEWPRGNPNALPSGSYQLMFRVVEWLRRIRSNPGVYTVDVWPEAADPASTNGSPKEWMLATDGISPSPGIAYLTGKKIASIVNQLFPEISICPASNGDIYDASLNPTGVINANPMVQGTGGSVGTNAYGIAPDGYILSASPGLTVTGSQVMVNGRSAFRMVVRGTATQDHSYASLRQEGLANKVSQGDVIMAGYDCVVSEAHKNFASPGIVLDTGVVSGSVYGGLSAVGDNSRPEAAIEPFSAVPLTPDFPIDNLPVSLSLDLRPYFTASLQSHLVIDIFSAFVRKG